MTMPITRTRVACQNEIPKPRTKWRRSRCPTLRHSCTEPRPEQVGSSHPLRSDSWMVLMPLSSDTPRVVSASQPVTGVLFPRFVAARLTMNSSYCNLFRPVQSVGPTLPASATGCQCVATGRHLEA
jgi:hypothetical protein